MSQTKNFNLPDLGEGLPDATIVEWFVKEGDVIKLDEPLVSMETAKAVVEVPSPFSGTVLKLSGAAGDIIPTGAVLASFALDPNLPQRADGQDTGHSHGHAAPAAPTPPPLPTAVHAEQALAVGGVKAVPAVRATARKLGVDLSRVRATGTDGAVTMADVKQAVADGSAKIGAAPAAVAAPAAAAPAPAQVAAPVQSDARTPLSAAGKPMRTQPPGVVAKGQPEPLKGVRRNMARVMADAHSKVVPTTLNDDADIHAWLPGNDVTARLVRSIVVAAQKVPAMNAWFDGDALTRTLHAQVDIGIAVDTDDGLFVPALRNADMLDARGIREGVNRLREQVEARSIAASELSGYTISLSNFGMFAGRYATPVVVPPCVAIVGAGRARHQMTPVMGGVEAHKVIPLSVTFDHRAATGGEAARFLRAMMDDLALAS
ncbi:dihydrolipoamide acetyltransferase family protein [Stenotrophomonas lactitubi]|uniref:dihydrolipoamide acetyltransferase family protein n=1 Tax=Stenotrophomonas lactitubi TaxID=2045214 RepID=UPI0028993762|nr:dihydrolipoamide acetyltransferase family protein [Stenotrophomonas lactitubi]